MTSFLDNLFLFGAREMEGQLLCLLKLIGTTSLLWSLKICIMYIANNAFPRRLPLSSFRSLPREIDLLYHCSLNMLWHTLNRVQQQNITLWAMLHLKGRTPTEPISVYTFSTPSFPIVATPNTTLAP